jgi:predicted RNA binding protein YcfA (HicA-like mRNA interferase family)
MNSSREEVLNELKNSGWSQVRQSGSHLIFKNPAKPNTISVPQDSRGHNTRTYKGILCALRNGSKFERRELKGVTMETQTPKPASISPELKAQILTNMKHNETWKPIHGFPDYEVSRDGSVRRAYRTLAGGGREKLEEPTPVEVGIHGKDRKVRPVIRMRKAPDKAYTTSSLHNVVAVAFLPPPPATMNMPVAVSKNGADMDVRVENLVWVPRATLIEAGRLKSAEAKAVTKIDRADVPSDDQILAAATAFENGATLEKAGKVMKRSSYVAKKYLEKIFGEPEFQALLDLGLPGRRNLAKEKRRLAKEAKRQPPQKPEASAPEPYTPAPAVEIPKPVLTAKPPEAAYSIPYMPPTTMNLTDITNMKAEVRNGMAYVELEMEMGSPTFLLLCKWQAKKG